MSENETIVRDGDITIRFGDEVYHGNYLDDLRIEGRDLNEVLMQHPALYAFWSKLSAISRIIYDKAKFELEKYEAQLYTYLKNTRESKGEKVTEKMLENLVRLDNRRQELFNSMLRARLQYDHLNAVREAFAARTSMLMSLAANLREEMVTSMSVSSESARRTDERARLLIKKANE